MKTDSESRLAITLKRTEWIQSMKQYAHVHVLASSGIQQGAGNHNRPCFTREICNNKDVTNNALKQAERLFGTWM